MKRYFVYKETKEWYHWEAGNWDKLHFCGNPKFIVGSLVSLYWAEEWKKIFESFMRWVENIKNLKGSNTWDTATFVLYRWKKNENKDTWSSIDQEIYN